jgi:pilus assembly protein CpaB
VRPGTFVDVLATANPTQKPEDVTSKVVLTNVQVLTSGTRLEQDTADGKPMQVTVVTLLVTPEEAERLTLASTEGRVQLALRNPLDAGAPLTPGVKTDALLGGRPKAPARSAKPARSAPPPPPTVEIIRGDKRERAIVS